MKNTNENKGNLEIVNFADARRRMEQAEAESRETGDDVQVFCVLSRKDAEPDPELEEALSSLGTFLRPTPQPTPEEVAANPESFVILDRQALVPYFPEEMSAEKIELIILAMLEADRMCNE